MAFSQQIAAATIYCEASSATLAEIQAVAFVIANRVRDGRFGKTASEVCLKYKQFSEWNGDQVNNKNLLRFARLDDSDLTLNQCLIAYYNAISLAISDPTHGACYYHDKSIQPPIWTKDMTKTLETTSFIFYRDR